MTRKYRWPLLAGWVIALLLASVGALSIGSHLGGGGWYVSGSQSQLATEQLAGSGMLGRGEIAATLVVHDREHVATDPEFDGRVRDVVDRVSADPELQVSGAYGWSTLSPALRDSFLGEDQRTATISVAVGMEDDTARRELPAVHDRLAEEFGPRGLDVALVGAPSFWGEVNVMSQQDLVLAEVITFPLIALILLLLYRSVVAAATSLVVGGTAIVFTLGALAPVAQQVELSVFLENAATMLGLGVAVDYSLFVVSRFQEELRRGYDVPEAVTRSLRYAGHTVVFSGLTVVATMSTLFIVDLNVIQSIALGAMTVVAFSMLTSVVVLPTLLHLIGHRINKGRLPFLRAGTIDSTRSSGRWQRFSFAVMRRPVLLGLVGVAILGVLALPVGGLRTFSPDARIISQESPVRVGFDQVQQQFSVGETSPVQVVVSDPGLPESAGDLVELNDALAALPGGTETRSVVSVLRQVSPERPLDALRPQVFDRLPDDVQQSVRHYLSPDGRTTVIEILPLGRASDENAKQLVEDTRATVVQHPALNAVVGGETAEGMDADRVIQDSLPGVVALMLLVVFVLLLATFRSLLLALKAVAMNLLSLVATYGILVAVFQEGIGADLLGLSATGYLQNFVPVLLLGLLFSLSTDYEVFLLNRVRENYLESGDNRAAVAAGVQSTAPLISGAAVLMVAVFGAFAFTGMVPIEQLGFGMAVAILLDATLVRLILVPATMRLLGRWNWWPGLRAPRTAAVSEEPRHESAETERQSATSK